jgi:hypothetical protein
MPAVVDVKLCTAILAIDQSLEPADDLEKTVDLPSKTSAIDNRSVW